MKKTRILVCVLLSVVFVCVIVVSSILAYSDRAPGEPFSIAQKWQTTLAIKDTLAAAGNKNAQNYTVYWEDESPALNKGNYLGPFMYLGVFDGAMVIYNTGGASMAVITPVSLGGYRFVFPDSTLPAVIFEGKVYGFKYAYDAGLLTDEDVGEIYAYWHDTHSYLYN